MESWLTFSSVAGGGGGSSPPIGLWSMQNRMFLVLLRPIFCEKLKTAPLKRLNLLNWTKNQSQFWWRPFFFFFFLLDHLILGGKNLWISELSEKFRLKFRTNRVKLIQGQWKFGSRSFALFSLFQNSPPPPLFQILATRLLTFIAKQLILQFWTFLCFDKNSDAKHTLRIRNMK